MGQRGPAPIPTELLAARGSWRADAREGEPDSPVEAPGCPALLTGEARKEWFNIVPHLLQRRTLSVVDHGHLAGMCWWWGRFVALAKKEARGKGATLKQVAEAWEKYSRAAQQFGLTPASKARVQSAAPEKKPIESTATELKIAE